MKDKNFLILGASSGLGRDVTKSLISEGSFVTGIGRSEEKLDDLSKELNNKNFNQLPYTVKDFEDCVENLSDLSKSFGPFDGVFNSLGQERFKALKMIKSQDIDKVFMPIFFSSLAVIKLSLKRSFLSENGSIVLMSSVSSQSGKSGMALYASARGAIESLIKSSAHELAVQNKRINSIRAGAVKTEMHQRLISNLSEDQIKAYEAEHLLGFGDVKDITEIVKFLLSDKSKWITGTSVDVDGGFLA